VLGVLGVSNPQGELGSVRISPPKKIRRKNSCLKENPEQDGKKGGKYTFRKRPTRNLIARYHSLMIQLNRRTSNFSTLQGV